MVMSGENRDPQSEPGIGRSLEKARKDRGLSLWQVEQETRIRSRYLRDLEREDFDVLPAVYVLGSLKTYADFLGLDGAALSRQLKASLVEPDEPEVAAQVAAIGGARDEEDEYEADRKSTRLNSSHANISYAVFCLKKKKEKEHSIAHLH